MAGAQHKRCKSVRDSMSLLSCLFLSFLHSYRTHAPGDKPHIADVKEQRVSGLCVSILVGLSVTAAPLLRKIPMAVLFGVFLYMGIASMTGVQFFERLVSSRLVPPCIYFHFVFFALFARIIRLSLFFMPVKYHPPEPYVRRLPAWKMHVYTMVQVGALVVLWTVKSSEFSLAFPFFLIMMVPLRQRLTMFFNARELNAVN